MTKDITRVSSGLPCQEMGWEPEAGNEPRSSIVTHRLLNYQARHLPLQELLKMSSRVLLVASSFTLVTAWFSLLTHSLSLGIEFFTGAPRACQNTEYLTSYCTKNKPPRQTASPSGRNSQDVPSADHIFENPRGL